MSRYYLDPGSAKLCALAAFESGRLASLDWVDPVAHQIKPVSGRVLTEPEAIIWEKPQIYPKSKGNPNQLIDLAVAGAAAVEWLAAGSGSCAFIKSLTPKQWKGNVAKPTHHMRLHAVLTEAERALFPNVDGRSCWDYVFENARQLALTGKEPSYSAAVVDLLDAAALGCYDLGRLEGPVAGRVARPKTADARKRYRKQAGK